MGVFLEKILFDKVLMVVPIYVNRMHPVISFMACFVFLDQRRNVAQSKFS